jgi:hypothetical protein
MDEREAGTAVCDEEAARERCAALYPRDLPKREYDEYLKGRPSDTALENQVADIEVGREEVDVMFEHHTNRFQTRFGQLVCECFELVSGHHDRRQDSALFMHDKGHHHSQKKDRRLRKV